MSATFPWLSLIIGLPLAGALLCACIRHLAAAQWCAVSITVLELAATLKVLSLFHVEDGDQFQLVEKHAYLPGLNIDYLIGIDGISVQFLPLSALLTMGAVVAGWNTANRLPHFHLALLLALEGVTMGVFTALDTVLFFSFWELTLPLIFFLISLWGIGPERRGAAMKYTMFMLFGSVPLLFGIVILAVNHATVVGGRIPQDLAFSMPVLLETPLQEHWQTLVFVLLLTGFAVKAPLVPLHTWLPTVAMEGPAPVTALLVGLKLGAYGIIRLAMPLAPSAAVQYSWLLGILGAITLIYGALIALQQTNLRRLLAYAGISHVGLIIIGIASLNIHGIQGTLLQLFNFVLSAASLMLIAGFIQHRLGSTEAIHLGGLAKVMPRLTAFYFLFMLASIGIPGTNGFPAELLLIVGALTAHPSLGITALAGAVLGSAYTLNYSRRAFFGPVTHPAVGQIQDLRPRELAVLSIPAVLVLIFGFFPDGLVKTGAAATEAWLDRLLEQPIKESRESDRGCHWPAVHG